MITLCTTALGRMMPMFLLVGEDGLILDLGPTLSKVLPEARGKPFFEVLSVRRPAQIRNPADLAARAGERLRLTLNTAPDTTFRATLAVAGGRQMLLNLSFGITVVEAVGRHGLTDNDFATTDLTVELLYLVEAKSAVMAELRRLNQRLQGAKTRAEEEALTDTLTGLKNRRALEAALRGLIDSSMPFGLMQIDLDYFKQVNDRLGHAAGDHVLGVVATVMRRETRAADFIARVGGDEFVLLLPGLVEPSTLLKVANRIIQGLQEPIPFDDSTCNISGSIGIASSAQYDKLTAEQMMADADSATYRSKHAGRGRATLHGA